MATASDDYVSWEPLNLPLGVKVQPTDLQLPLKIVSQRKYIFPMSILAGLKYENMIYMTHLLYWTANKYSYNN